MRAAGRAKLIALLVMATVTAGMTIEAGTASASGVDRARPADFSTSAGALSAIAMTSGSNGWAVGSTLAINSGPLILHWDGSTWTQVKLPPLSGGFLSAIAANSARNAWAVGAIGAKNLILHWNGVRWSRIRCPSPRGNEGLISVTVTRSGAAWAVGFRNTRGGGVDVILRWIGGKWKVAANPAPTSAGLPAGAGLLEGVAAASDRYAWAVGMGAPGFWTVAARWNGSVWRQASMPNIQGGVLAAVTMAPHGDAWAVGVVEGNAKHSVLIMHWNGHSWRRVKSPDPPGAVLRSVTALRDGTAWAVGYTAAATSFILHWNGHSWRHVASPEFTVAGSSEDNLAGVSAISSGNAWAAGYTGGGGGLILRWDGSRWH
jgi:hypothetical protein